MQRSISHYYYYYYYYYDDDDDDDEEEKMSTRRLQITDADILPTNAQSEWAARARRSLKFCELQIHSITAPVGSGVRREAE
jgi:hypothetical protein